MRIGREWEKDSKPSRLKVTKKQQTWKGVKMECTTFVAELHVPSAAKEVENPVTGVCKSESIDLHLAITKK